MYITNIEASKISVRDEEKIVFTLTFYSYPSRRSTNKAPISFVALAKTRLNKLALSPSPNNLTKLRSFRTKSANLEKKIRTYLDKKTLKELSDEQLKKEKLQLHELILNIYRGIDILLPQRFTLKQYIKERLDKEITAKHPLMEKFTFYS